jgi:hypothetical protein
MSNELEEALTAAGVSALVQKVIDPLLLEYQRRYSPLMRAMPSKKWSSTDYYFNTRTQRAPGGFVTDGGARPVGNSVYSQASFKIRNMQAVGSVTGYAQEVTRQTIGDLRGQEIASTVQGLMWDVETAMLHGNSASTALGPYPQFDGLNSLINQYVATASNPQNAIDFNGASITLGALDQLIDMVESNASMPVGSEFMLIMSSTGNSRLAQLETQFQRFMGQTEVAAGLNVASYRDIPIIKSSFLGSKASTMGAVAITPGTTGGALAAGQYFYVIEPVVARYGALSPSTAVAGTTTGTTGTNTLAFTPPVGPDGASPLTYKVYRGATANACTLVGFVDAVVGLMGDGVTPIVATSIVDTGAALVPQNGATIPASSPAAYVGGSAEKPRVAGGEDIYLISRDPNYVVRPYVRDISPVDVYPTTSSPDALPFALVSDTCLAVRGPKFVGRLRNVVSTLTS